jgi:hypothetical protein
MEQGDHRRCPIELRACSQHGDERFSMVHREELDLSGLHEADASGTPATRTEQPLNEDWVRLKPIPPEIEEKLSEWFASDRESIGFCCLCGHSIRTEADFIKGRNTHDCEEGRAFEDKIRKGKR